MRVGLHSGCGWDGSSRCTPNRLNRRRCESALAEKLATSSIEVVQHQPGFLGYLVAGPARDPQREFIFASIWADADAVKARFGEEWRVSHLPPGYAELIEECFVDHYHLTGQSF